MTQAAVSAASRLGTLFSKALRGANVADDVVSGARAASYAEAVAGRRAAAEVGEAVSGSVGFQTIRQKLAARTAAGVAAVRAAPGGAAVGGLLAADTALFAGDIVGPPLEDALDFGREGRVADAQARMTRETALAMVRRRRLLADDQENMARVMATNPTLAQSAYAGRRVPEGGVVIGGPTGETGLHALARMMSEGQFDGPPDPEGFLF